MKFLRLPWQPSGGHYTSLSSSESAYANRSKFTSRTPGLRRMAVLLLTSTLIVLSILLVSSSSIRDKVRSLADNSETCRYGVTFECESCLHTAEDAFTFPSSPAGMADGSMGDLWRFDTERDGRRLDLDDEQCLAAFPGLFEDTERVKKLYQRRGVMIQPESMSRQAMKVSNVRAMVYNQSLYVISANEVNQFWFQSRARAILSSINRAVMTAKEPLPNVEFVFTISDSTDDGPFEDSGPNQAIMAFTRKHEYDHVWLMPDFGGWSYPETHLGTQREVAHRMTEVESVYPFEEKLQKIVWRGVEWTAPRLRNKLVQTAKDQDWADIKSIKWDDMDSMKKDYLPMEDHCMYQFLAYTEGRSYSGRLRYLQHCHSIIFAHKLQWIVPTNYLLVSNGSLQNFVEVARDFSDLNEKVQDLIDNPDKARLIADNSIKTFRDRYLQPAADACYWRHLLRAWRAVSLEPEFYVSPYPRERSLGLSGRAEGRTPNKYIPKRQWRGVPFESYILTRETVW